MDELTLTTLRAAIADTAGARQEIHQVYSWSTVAVAALFAGGLALIGQNEDFGRPAETSRVLIVATIFGLVIPGFSGLSGYIFLTQVARLLQNRMLTEAYEMALARALRDGGQPGPLLLREYVYRRWETRTSLAECAPRGADVTRNGYAFAALIYCLAAVGALITGASVVWSSPWTDGDTAWQIVVALVAVAVGLCACAGLVWQADRVRTLLRDRVDVSQDLDEPDATQGAAPRPALSPGCGRGAR